MKHLSLAMPAALLLLAIACSKPGAEKPGMPGGNQQRYAVKFKMDGGFTSQLDNLKQKSTGARAAADSGNVFSLYYYIDHALRIVQRSTDPSFGTILDSLPAGTHKLQVFVTNAVQDSSLVFTGSPMLGDTERVVMLPPGGDFFSKVYSFNVNGGAVNQTVILDRVVSRVHIILADVIPYNAARIDVELYAPMADTTVEPGANGFYNAYDFYNDILVPDNYAAPTKGSYYITDAERGKTGWNRNLYVFASDTMKLSLLFKAYSTAGALMARKAAYNLPAQRNRNVTLNGALFDGLPGGGGVIVGLPQDTTWLQGDANF